MPKLTNQPAKASPRWELYDAMTGKVVEKFYVYNLGPFLTRKQAHAAANSINHRWGTNLSARAVKRG